MKSNSLLILALFILIAILIYQNTQLQSAVSENKVLIETNDRYIEVMPDTVHDVLTINKPFLVVQHDTVNRLIPDSLLRQAYDSLATAYDSLNKERNYLNKYEDSLISIELSDKARGYLLHQEMKYKIKPIKVTDTTKTIIKQNRYIGLYGYGSISSTPDASIGFGIGNDRLIGIAQYSPFTKTMQTGIGIRLIKFKTK